MHFEPDSLDTSKLLLDPNNYRFYDRPNWNRVEENRYHEGTVQANTLRLLQNDKTIELQALRDSILKNGWIQLERIVVRPYSHDSERWVIVEGNRRVAAIKWLLEMNVAATITLSDKQKKDISSIDVLVLDPKKEGNQDAVRVIMGIRHVAGIKEWGAYQQALLVQELRDKENLSLANTSERLGMSKVETNRRYRAAKALHQMKEDEEFGELATPRLYNMFLECFTGPVIREWLGWKESNMQFNDEENRLHFYDLITSSEDDGREVSPKLRTYSDVRSLKKILANEEARAALLDPDKTLADAIGLTVEPDPNAWLKIIRSACKALSRMSADKLENIEDRELKEINNLIDVATKTARRAERLKR